MDICCCPETSRDANGPTGITEVRFYLMQLDIEGPKLYSAKAPRVKMEMVILFVLLFISLSLR